MKKSPEDIALAICTENRPTKYITDRIASAIRDERAQLDAALRSIRGEVGGPDDPGELGVYRNGLFDELYAECDALKAQLKDALASGSVMRDTLALIAAPKRRDGTYNRNREACEKLARQTLEVINHDDQRKPAGKHK